jgi:TolB-like protein
VHNKTSFLTVFIILCFLLFFSSSVYSAEKIAVAVLDFDAKNISQESAEAVTDLLRTELFNTGRFKVVERQRIKRILEEIQFQSSGLTDADQAAEIGRLLNVSKIMIGTVTRLGETHLINTRMVDVQSGLVILAESVESTGGEGKLPGAIIELALTVANKVGLEGSILRVDENLVYIDLGKSDGITIGQKLDVVRLGDPITDLEGRVIGAQEEVIAKLEITKVDEAFSIADVLKNSDYLKRGDKIKPGSDTEVTSIKKPVEKKQKEEVPKKKEPKEKEDEPDAPVIF